MDWERIVRAYRAGFVLVLCVLLIYGLALLFREPANPTVDSEDTPVPIQTPSHTSVSPPAPPSPTKGIFPLATQSPPAPPSPTKGIFPLATQSRTGPELKLLIPLYSYPNWYDPDNYIWDDIVTASAQIPITAIINPSNGPGGDCPNSDYEHGLDQLRNGDVTIIGYVDTDYGNRPIDDVLADIELYDRPCFNTDGVFLDQVASSADRLDYYATLYDHARALVELDRVFLNPGTNTDQEYLSRPACDSAVIFEGYSSDWPDYQPDSYVLTYPPERFAMIVHSVPDTDTMRSHIDLAVTPTIGYVYITNDTLPNPYDELPSFWRAQIDHILSLAD